jgi:hypothetical protein
MEPQLGRDCRNLVKLTPLARVPIGRPEAEPQGNAMLSVRIAAAGAVVSICASFLTVPASACDFDRYQKKCDRELAARADAEASAERKSVKRVRASSRRAARQARIAKRARSAPRFAAQGDSGIKLASAEARAVLLPEAVLARRFRGFIDPKPLSQNSFEVLRKPHPVALDFDPTLIVPAVATAAPAEAAPAAPEPPAAAPAVPATVATTPKQDKIAPKAAAMELASAESKPVALAPLASRPAAAPPVAPVQASVTESPNPASGFSLNQLVLALCGALGAASALRFIVGA